MLRERGGQPEVLIIHRPTYDDWSLPKGKLEPGESPTEAAVREIQEEASVTVALGRELEPVSYRDRRGRLKTVRWWLASVVEEGDWQPDDEVDDVRWVPITEASALLSYDHDRELLDQASTSLSS